MHGADAGTTNTAPATTSSLDTESDAQRDSDMVSTVSVCIHIYVYTMLPQSVSEVYNYASVTLIGVCADTYTV
jgi:hypothetical protein